MINPIRSIFKTFINKRLKCKRCGVNDSDDIDNICSECRTNSTQSIDKCLDTLYNKEYIEPVDTFEKTERTDKNKDGK